MQANLEHPKHGNSLLDFATHHNRELGLGSRRFSRGSMLFVPHTAVNSVFIIRYGRLRVSAPAESGQQVFLAELGAGDIVGEVSAITGSREATIVEAVEDTEAFVFTRPAFLRVLQECPEGSLQVMRILCERLKSSNTRHMEKVSLSMAERLAIEIGRLARVDDDGTFEVRNAPTHSELADRIGSHREAVTKELRRLSREGALEVRRGLIRVLKPDKLFPDKSPSR